MHTHNSSACTRVSPVSIYTPPCPWNLRRNPFNAFHKNYTTAVKSQGATHTHKHTHTHTHTGQLEAKSHLLNCTQIKIHTHTHKRTGQLPRGELVGASLHSNQGTQRPGRDQRSIHKRDVKTTEQVQRRPFTAPFYGDRVLGVHVE